MNLKAGNVVVLALRWPQREVCDESNYGIRLSETTVGRREPHGDE